MTDTQKITLDSFNWLQSLYFYEGFEMSSSPKGIRVNIVSPGWIETDASIAFLGEIARTNNINVEQAKQSVMDALGGIPIQG